MSHTEPENAPSATDHWVIVTMKNGDDQLLMRLRTDRPIEEDIDAFATVVLISWEYPPQPGTVQPPEDTWEKMNIYEDAVADLGWENNCSYLMNISTGLGAREWCYYIKDRDDFMRRFNTLLSGHDPYPLNIVCYDDPEWEIWHDKRLAYERAGGSTIKQWTNLPPKPPRLS